MDRNNMNEATVKSMRRFSIERRCAMIGILLALLLRFHYFLPRDYPSGEIKTICYSTPLDEEVQTIIHVTFWDKSFESHISDATDVVIARCIDSRPFGERHTEFEFEVIDRVRGNAADRIFIYVLTDVTYGHYQPTDITFSYGTDYLLPLRRIDTPYQHKHDDGYWFVSNIVINLDRPSHSTMFNNPLAEYSRSFDFSRRLPRRTIISRVRRLTWNRRTARTFIRSEDMREIINGSPHVWIVGIGEASSLSSQGGGRRPTDIYYVTLVESLKGDIDVVDELEMIFFADTVFPGERHIVAVERRSDSSFYTFTSRSSLFSMDQLDEIMEIIDN